MRNNAYKINVSWIIFIILLLYNGKSRFRTLGFSVTKGNCKFEIFLVKVFSQKKTPFLRGGALKKKKSSTSSCYRKIRILSLQENSLMFLQTIKNFVEISNHAFKYTKNHNGTM